MLKKAFLLGITLLVSVVLFSCNDLSTTFNTTTNDINETTHVTTTYDKTTEDVTTVRTEDSTTTTTQDILNKNYGVINGGFESNMQEWEYYTKDGFHDIDLNTFKNGQKSLSIENGVSNYTSIWQTVEVGEINGPLSGDFVNFSAFFKGEANTTGTIQLIIENVISDTNKVLISKSEKVNLGDDWIYIETEVGEIPENAMKINIVMIVETTGVVNVDDVLLNKTLSNNSKLRDIKLDGVLLDNFLPDVHDYTVYLPTNQFPLVTCNAVKEDSTISINQATNFLEKTKIIVEAADGTITSYTISYVLANKTELKSIKIDNTILVGFDSSKTDYNVILNNSSIPTITFETFYNETVVTIDSNPTTPQMVSITVTNGDEFNIYTINFIINDENSFNMPNFDFEDSFDWQTWSGTSDEPSLSTEIVHSGLYSLKTIHQSSVWKELDFSANIPNVGDAVKIGAWIYIDSETPLYDFKLKIVGYTNETGEKQVFTEVSIFEGVNLQKWVYIESDYSDILKCDKIQFVIENNTDSIVYVDHIVVIDTVSSNAYLSDIILDTVKLSGFDSTITNYSFLTDGNSIPQVSALPQNPNSKITITQSTSVDGQANILVEAEDGSSLTYVINFLIPSSGLLNDITINGVSLEGFVATKNIYYIKLPANVVDFPIVQANSIDNSDIVIINQGSLPGYSEIIVQTLLGVTNKYRIYAEVYDEKILSTPYPDVNFEKNLENWGFSSNTDITQTSELYLEGLKSLKMIGGEAWIGFDLAGGDYPERGYSYSVGMWLYLESSSNPNFRIKLIEKENNIILLNQVVDITEFNSWIYVETDISSSVSHDAGYIQVVITNETGETIYVDSVRLVKHDPIVDVVEDTVYDMTNKNLNFETTQEWGFWSPSGTGVGYSSEIAKDSQSLKFSEGSAWLGFGFDGSAYPSKGDNVKLGFWVYVDSESATSVGGFTIKLLEKEGNIPGDEVVILYTTTDMQFEFDKWVYIETETTVISEDPSYLQIVIEEGTDGVVYLDDISIIKVSNK